MEKQEVRELEEKCIQEQPPACTATCPVHLDVRGMIDVLKKDNFTAARAILHRYVTFPGIISRICDHPCQKTCKRIEAGDAIRIRDLERACLDYGAAPATPRVPPKKSSRIAVIGGGLSGVTAAVELASKGHQVTIFEKNDCLLGRLRELGKETLPPQVIDTDLARLDDLGVEIKYFSPLSEGADEGLTLSWFIDNFDAVYLGIGSRTGIVGAIPLRPSDDGSSIRIHSKTFATSEVKVFAGGSLRYAGDHYSPITSLQDGKYAAISIDRLLQRASLDASREQDGSYVTRLYTNTKGIPVALAAPMDNPLRGYKRDEAVAEAQRCISCECRECVKQCEYLAHYKSYPKRYIRELYNNYSIVLGNHASNRLMNSCALCGLCEAVCPENVSMADVCLKFRQGMVEKGKMPPSPHEFALRDLAFSSSDAFTLARHQPGFTSSTTVFYPGCQLAASSPEQVERVYKHLQSAIPGGVGLVLGCCGASAEWAGRKDLFAEALQSVAAQCESLNCSRVITACSTCYRMFKDHLPSLQVESLWTLLDKAEVPVPICATETKVVAIHDPCTTRHDDDVQDSIRHLLDKLGVKVAKLEHDRELTTCCGFGGLVLFANREVADKVVNRRIQESADDYLTYCVMCRDNFAAKGKRALHILDFMFGDNGGDPAARKRPTFSERNENRARLKNRLLRELWGEIAPDEEQSMKLVISPEISELMNQRMILTEDVEKTVAHCEATSDKFIDPATGHSVGSYRPATVTYWVEYSGGPEEFVVHNAYSHRMDVRGNN